MKESTIKEARNSLDRAMSRLFLDDIDEEDVEKAVNHIEDAKNQLE